MAYLPHIFNLHSFGPSTWSPQASNSNRFHDIYLYRERPFSASDAALPARQNRQYLTRWPSNHLPADYPHHSYQSCRTHMTKAHKALFNLHSPFSSCCLIAPQFLLPVTIIRLFIHVHNCDTEPRSSNFVFQTHPTFEYQPSTSFTKLKLQSRHCQNKY